MQPDDRSANPAHAPPHVQPAREGRDAPPKLAGVHELDGRLTELRLVQEFLALAFESGASLLLSGPAGIGKTALLDAAAHAAASEGALVLRAQGVEFEAELPYWGLNQLLQPLTVTIPRLGATHRAALSIALGLAEGPSSDGTAAMEAAVELVATAASAGPVLVVIDDPQWLDRSSAAVLASLAAQVSGKRVGVLVATRSPNPGHFNFAEMPQLRVTSLDADASARLLSRRHPRMTASARERLLQIARGNPLALLELPLALDPQEAAFPEVLPLTKHLERVFAARVQAVPADVRRTMLLVALEGTGDLSVLSRCVPPEELVGLTSDDPAGLVYRDGSRVLFRHPLMRSTVVALSSGAERAAVHQALAPVVAAERRAWHLAEAATGPDDEIARLVEGAAHAVLGKGDAVGAVRYLVRSAELSTVPSERARRLAVAAYVGADVTGDLKPYPGCSPEQDRIHPSALRSRPPFLLLNSDGAIDDAHRLLMSAIRGADLSGGDDDALDNALQTLLMVCSFGGRKELWQPFHDWSGSSARGFQRC
jgi:hypothetical protein